MNRRDFLMSGAAALACFAFPRGMFAQNGNVATPFKMNFAPRIPMDTFRSSAGKDLLERTQWFYDNGFRAIEGAVFFDHKKQSESQIKEQIALGELVKKLGMEMGCISSMNEKNHPVMTANYAPDKKVFDRSATNDFLLWQMEETFEIMRRLGANTFIIGAGVADKDIPFEKQYENTVENMKFCAAHCLKNGFIMEIEPLNELGHKNIFISHAKIGAQICADVNSPACKLLYDIYHEQVQVGNNDALDDDEVFKHILSFHIADDPGRNEPGSGKIDYETILGKIWEKGFRGHLGLEHGQTDKSKKGDIVLLETYRRLDSVAS